MSKRKFFSLAEKVKIINYAEKNPHLSSRKLAEEFGCGRTCNQTLINQDEAILTDLKCHENYFLEKKGRSEEFQDAICRLVLYGKGSTGFWSYDSRRSLAYLF